MIGSNSKPYEPLLILLFLLILHRHCTDAQSPIQPIKPITRHRSAWDPSMIIFIVVLVGTFFLVALFSTFLRHCAEFCCVVPLQGNNNNNPQWSFSCSEGGIDPKTLETFPTLLYSTVKDIRIPKEGVPEAPLECAICIAEFTDDDTLRLLPHCNHVFHPPCIDAWLSSHVTCPVCRANLDRDPAEVAVTVIAQPSGGHEIDAEGSENRAEQNDAGGSEIEGNPVEREASEGQRSGEESKGARECAPRSKLVGKKTRITRSSTTGHSVVEAGECMERYTLRLPEDVRKYIILNRRVAVMQRSASYNVVGSGTKGLCWSDSDGSSRGKRVQGSSRGKGRMGK